MALVSAKKNAQDLCDNYFLMVSFFLECNQEFSKNDL